MLLINDIKVRIDFYLQRVIKINDFWPKAEHYSIPTSSTEVSTLLPKFFITVWAFPLKSENKYKVQFKFSSTTCHPEFYYFYHVVNQKNVLIYNLKKNETHIHCTFLFSKQCLFVASSFFRCGVINKFQHKMHHVSFMS